MQTKPEAKARVGLGRDGLYHELGGIGVGVGSIIVVQMHPWGRVGGRLMSLIFNALLFSDQDTDGSSPTTAWVQARIGTNDSISSSSGPSTYSFTISPLAFHSCYINFHDRTWVATPLVCRYSATF